MILTKLSPRKRKNDTLAYTHSFKVRNIAKQKIKIKKEEEINIITIVWQLIHPHWYKLNFILFYSRDKDLLGRSNWRSERKNFNAKLVWEYLPSALRSNYLIKSWNGSQKLLARINNTVEVIHDQKTSLCFHFCEFFSSLVLTIFHCVLYGVMSICRESYDLDINMRTNNFYSKDFHTKINLIKNKLDFWVITIIVSFIYQLLLVNRSINCRRRIIIYIVLLYTN